MVNNQTEFNNKYSKETKEIKLKRKDFQGQLVIEDYSDLKKLYFYDIQKINKIILKNLPQLQECTIWDCGVKDLIIENCSQIKKLNIRSNLLTNLEFLKSLPNLEELELDGNTEVFSSLEHLTKSLTTFSFENTKLANVLKYYQGDWRTYKKDIHEIIELANQRPHELLKNIWDLKENQHITIDNPADFKKKYQKLKKKLNFLLKEEELKTEEINSLKTDDLIEGLEKQKNSLFKLKKTNQKLKKQLSSFEELYLAKKEKMEQKEKELEELKSAYLEKAKNYRKVEKKLNELLECQAEIIINNSEYVRKRKNEIREKIIQKTKLTTEEIDNLCQLQTEITQLKLDLQKKLDKVVNNYYNQGFIVSGDHANLSGAVVKDIEMKINAYEEENSDTELQTAIEAPLPKKYLN